MTESSVTLELPVLGDGGMHTLTMPVSFDNDNLSVLDEISDLNNMSLMEVDSEDLCVPSEGWNSELESIFLPEKSNYQVVRRKAMQITPDY